MTEHLSRTAVRRAALLCPDGERLALLPLLQTEVMIAPLDPETAIERLMAYLLDPKGRAMLALDDKLAAWAAGSPMLRACPLDDRAPRRCPKASRRRWCSRCSTSPTSRS